MAASADRAAELQHQQYQQTRQDMMPFLAFGQSAIGPASQLLGLNPSAAPIQTQAPASAAGFDASAYLQANPDLAPWAQRVSQERAPLLISEGYDRNGDGRISVEEAALRHWEKDGRAEGRSVRPAAAAPAQATAQVQQTTGSPAQAPTTLETLMQRPGVQASFDAGRRAVEQSAYGTGKSGGGVLKDLQGYGMQFGDTLYNNEVSRLMAVMNGGQAATQSLGSFGANAAGNQASALMAGGNARASSYANNPWATGMGFASGFIGGGGADALGGAVSNWWNGRNDPKPFKAGKFI